MKKIVGLCVAMLSSLSFAYHAQTINSGKGQELEKNYIFFLHNRFVEANELNVPHPQYGKAEYYEILNAFRKEGFIVLSKKRKLDTEVKTYAKKICLQIDSLLKLGVRANHITVIGTSKGGYIAQYVSTFMANPDLNFVFVACFQESDLEENPDINYCGNILTIYEKSDPLGVSAITRKTSSKLKVSRFREIELNTNLRHGFQFKALPAWLGPCKRWAQRDYDFVFTGK